MRVRRTVLMIILAWLGHSLGDFSTVAKEL
jgi:hypothetical protein